MCLSLCLKYLGESAELKPGTMACLSIQVFETITVKQIHSTRYQKIFTILNWVNLPN